MYHNNVTPFLSLAYSYDIYLNFNTIICACVCSPNCLFTPCVCVNRNDVWGWFFRLCYIQTGLRQYYIIYT